jgi:hypothetical protein
VVLHADLPKPLGSAVVVEFEANGRLKLIELDIERRGRETLIHTCGK